MRLLRKRSTYLLFITLFIFSMISDIFGYESVLGNPIPWDENWTASPFPNSYNSYNGSILFEHEYINVTFDEEKAIIIANYSFNNPSETASNITLVIPFINAYNVSQKPEFSKILLDETNISYEWRNVGYVLYPLYSSDTFETYFLIELKLDFDPFEKKVLSLHYTRDYLIYNSSLYADIKYEYRYFVGSLTYWNHSIESAEFDFRVPKAICYDIPSFWRPDYLGDHTSAFIEYDTYYSLNLKFENWTLAPTVVNDDGEERSRSLYTDFVILRWTERKPFNLFAGIDNAHILVISLACLVVITIRRKQR